MRKSEEALNSWKTVLKNAKIKPYNACCTQFWLWVRLIGISIVCTLLIPFVLRFIVMWFSEPIFPWSDWFMLKPDCSTDAAISLLPDFLGGMAGILVGFALDFTILDKIKTIRQYVSMLKPLDAEFDGILDNFYNFTEVSEIEFPVISGEKDFSEIDKNPIERQIIGEIFANYENSMILAQLPDLEIEKTLRKINRAILSYNETQSEADTIKIKNAIQEFCLRTAYKKRKRVLAKKWCTIKNGSELFIKEPWEERTNQ